MVRWMRLLGAIVVVSAVGLGVSEGRAAPLPIGGVCRDIGLAVLSEHGSYSVWAPDGPGPQTVIDRHLGVIVTVSDSLRGQPVVLRSIGPWLRIDTTIWPGPAITGHPQVKTFANGGLEMRWPAGDRDQQDIFLVIPERYPASALSAIPVSARVVGGRCTASLRLRFVNIDQ